MTPPRFAPVLLLAPFLALAPLHAATPTDIIFKIPGDGPHTGDAVPLGNGLFGALVRGSGRNLSVTLDRADLVLPNAAPGLDPKVFNREQLVRFFKENRPAPAPLGEPHPFLNPYKIDRAPVRLPLGRIEFTLPTGTDIAGFTLNPVGAEVRADSSRGFEATAFVHSGREVVYLWFPHGLADFKIVPPEEIVPPTSPTGNKPSGRPRKDATFADLKLPAGTKTREADRQLFTRKLDDKNTLTLLVRKLDTPHGTVCVITAATTKDLKSPAGAVEKLTDSALADGYDNALNNHRGRRVRQASRSAIVIPEPAIAELDAATRYLFGSAIRRGAAPVASRGVWTTDHGRLPENLGAIGYESVLNHLPGLLDGQKEESVGLRDFLVGKLPAFRRHAKNFEGLNGATIPARYWADGSADAYVGTESLVSPTAPSGPNIGMNSPLPAAVHLHYLLLEWRHHREDEALKKKTLPFAQEVAGAYRRALPLEGPAVLTGAEDPVSVEALRRIFLMTRDLCLGADLPDEAAAWAALADRVPAVPAGTLPPAVSDSGVEHLLAHRDVLATGGNLAMAAYLDAIAPSGTAENRERALLNLRQLAEPMRITGQTGTGHRHPNGMLDHSAHRLSPAGTNLLINTYAALALREMLLSSRVPPGGEPNAEVVTIFPAVPEAWAEAEFTDLSAAGGYTVSAIRKKGRTQSFRIDTLRSGPIRIRNNFGDRRPTWSREGVTEQDGVFVFDAKAGDSLAARFE